jgi:hypothetical protein
MRRLRSDAGYALALSISIVRATLRLLSGRRPIWDSVCFFSPDSGFEWVAIYPPR